MALPELVQRKAEKSLKLFCGEGIGKEGSPQLRFSRDGTTFMIWQLAPRSGGPEADLPVAQLRYHDVLGQWTLHYPGGDGRWRLYLNSGPTLDLDKLLQHLKLDPFQTFWP
jgi:Protein of unknown function (DUF3024)